MAKHIFMPKDLRDKWLAALRSGEHKQAHNTLIDRKTGGMCCLGLLQLVADGVVEDDVYPSEDWRIAHKVRFTGEEGQDGGERPWLPSANECATRLNDSGMPFVELADHLEAAIECTEDM